MNIKIALGMFRLEFTGKLFNRYRGPSKPFIKKENKLISVRSLRDIKWSRD